MNPYCDLPLMPQLAVSNWHNSKATPAGWAMAFAYWLQPWDAPESYFYCEEPTP